MAETICTISFVLSVSTLVAHSLLTRTHVVCHIDHRFSFALRTANGSRFARLVINGLFFTALTFFAYHINHRFGLALRTANGSSLAREVKIRLSFPAPTNSVLRFHGGKSPMCRTAFRFSIKKPIGSPSFTIQIFAQFRHVDNTMYVLIFKRRDINY